MKFGLSCWGNKVRKNNLGFLGVDKIKFGESCFEKEKEIRCG